MVELQLKVRFFSFLGRNRNRNRLPNKVRTKKTGLNHKKPVQIISNQSELQFGCNWFELIKPVWTD